ncbi:hypothetical protein [Clostridium magnum]|uniref:Uncharacterized protein n=1 Tax=Clostridium magnum DSM 2767 TaxID=1121326 RepID=A0A161WES0_9CLOT|nr:hypothetical protein [Clostridium magnum]KZL90165.1 hypothetical protein CLMAG_46580 [Clostridium magnum DSM 2767]SHH62909.1 hypothetical protein SAMN02745944_01038 [Clostridium magnum DSM 2767]
MLFNQDNSKWNIKELEDTYELICYNDKSSELREILKVVIE